MNASIDRRTLLVVTPFPLAQGGGLGSYVSSMIDALISDHNWRVVLVTSGSRRRGVQREDIGHLRTYRLPYEIQISATRFGVGWRRQLKRIIRDESPVIINVHAPTPGLADVAATVVGDIPLVVTYHAGSMHKGRMPADAFVAIYENVVCPRLLGRADWVIASSDFVRNSFLLRVRAKCSTITPGVDIERFTPAATAPQSRVLFVAGLRRADAHKGLDTLLQAMKTLVVTRPDVTLDVVGSGDDLGRYQKLCLTLGIDHHVCFRGRLAGSDLVEAYQAATVLALPTTNESFGMVLLEAMACGVPVVSTTAGGVPSLVEDGRQGYLVAPGDVSAFTDRIGRILDDPSLGRRLGEAGRDEAKRLHTWSSHTARTNTILASVVAGRPGEGRHRLAIVAPKFKPTIGGLEHYAYQIATRFNALDDYEVVVLTSHEGHRTVVEVLDGLTVFRFPRWLKLSETPLNPLWPWNLRRAMSDNRVDVVNAHTPVPIMAEAAALACGRRPLVVTYHSGSMVKGKRWPDLLINHYERWMLPMLLRRADAVVSVSPPVSAHLGPHAAGKSFVVAPGVDTDMFVPADPEDALARPPTILYVGRLDRASAWKGIDHLLQAFVVVLRELPDAELVLVGGGDALEDHRQRAASLGILGSVRFHGALQGSPLVKAFQQATVVILPSTSEAEAYGMSLIEAMACKKPVIGSNIGGIPFVIDDGRDGLLVAPGDYQQLASACLEVLRSPALAAEMGERGWAKVQSLSWQSRVEQYEEIFTAVLGRDGV